MWLVCHHLREVNMLNKSEITRYSRQIQLSDFGKAGQERLKAARVVIIGAGGLGCPVIQYLSASGIGNITILDGDLVSESNLQRQLLYTQSDIGKYKAKQAARRAREINPYIEVKANCSFLNADLAFTLFSDADLIVDCTDNFGTRYLINDVCTLLSKPFVSAALFKYEGQLGIYNVKTETGYSANFRHVFPESLNSGGALDCNAAGVIATLPGLLGLYQANEVVKFFVDPSFCLLNKLLTVDCKRITHQVFEISNAHEIVKLSKEEILDRAYVLPCFKETKKEGKNIFDLLASLECEDTILVDVRELSEMPKVENIRHLTIPLSQLENRKEELTAFKKVVFICKSGVRSARAKASIEDVYTQIKFEICDFGAERLMQELNESVSYK